MSVKDLSRIEQDNAEALHFLTAPFRAIRSALQMIAFTLGIIFLVFINHVGWILDLGPRSEHSRAVHIAEMERTLKGYNGDEDAATGRTSWFTYKIDFRRQPDLDKPKTVLDTHDQDFYYGGDGDSAPTDSDWAEDAPYKAFTTTILNHPLESSEGIPYCVAPSPIFDTSLEPWAERGDSALDRKAARMRRDYEVAAVMTAALRSTIIHLKLHRSLAKVYGAGYVYALNKPIMDSYCNVLGGMHESQYGAAGAAAYRAVSKTVVLPDAPVIEIQEVAGVPGTTGTGALDFLAKPADLDRTENGSSLEPDTGMEVTGICLPDYCSDGLIFGTTYAADLFAKDPPLTGQQRAAEQALLAMTTKSFWARSARENGVKDLASVETMRHHALMDIQVTVNDPELGY
jgi:hypothetical protein